MSTTLQSNKILNPIFIICLIILLLNDFWFKSLFANAVTGKLSDFTGLFVFPFFWSYCFPRYTKQIHIGTAVGFIWFKSILFTPVLELLHTFSIPISRVIDYTDYIAMISIVISYHIFIKEDLSTSNVWSKRIVSCVAIFSFLATSQVPFVTFNYPITDQAFYFNSPKLEVIKGINKVQLKQMNKWNNTIAVAQSPIVMDSIAKVLRYDNNSSYIVGQLLEETSKDKDSVFYSTNLVKFVITEENHKTKITLLHIATNVVGAHSQNAVNPPYPKKEVKMFKQKLIKPLYKVL